MRAFLFDAMTIKTPKIQITQMLKEKLQTDGKDPAAFMTLFQSWKALGAHGEYESPYFGKDGAYREPTVANKMVLRHVHLRPSVDLAKQHRWDKQYDRRGQKVSDTALLYAEDSTHGLLLLDILYEPDGHEVAKMKTPESADYMRRLARMANAFIYTGQVIEAEAPPSTSERIADL
ncbi:type II toxin-antitoxin system YafO family toxin [Achromobacter mucicolens]|uniref:type II toxin-antitoxin system YafO family toxin n=1 Tax=Achromobacter mucicolens TaxID=1389922 RepID=UPI00244D1FAE|nr:type II toxin-antitoxin system YafO family toxin [Achromobacter mucicolens]MDH0093444.1 type II toxin-antitoxin system YafO family toxin [Achromobacter mucicolens]